jgi:hypothetical protein
LLEALTKGVEGIESTCMQADCNVKVTHSVFLNLLKNKFIKTSKKELGKDNNKKATDVYWKWLCKSFTDESKNIKWCPELGCDNCILLKEYATV